MEENDFEDEDDGPETWGSWMNAMFLRWQDVVEQDPEFDVSFWDCLLCSLAGIPWQTLTAAPDIQQAEGLPDVEIVIEYEDGAQIQLW